MNKLLAAAIALVALLLTGCGSTPEITAIETTVTSTVTVTEEAPAPPPVTVTETVAPELDQESVEMLTDLPEMQRAALDITWSQMSSTDQADICLGWSLTDLRPQLLDQFMSSSDGMFDRDLVEDYFNEVCG